MNLFLTNLKSGIVVFLVAIPLCLGIALACNVPLFSGLIAGIIGGIIITPLSGSVLSVSGPAAGLTSVVLAAVATLGSLQAFTAAVVVAGVVQVCLGIAKAGGIGNYIPSSVIKGMLAGIGIILIIKQLPHLVGYDAPPEGDFDFVRAGGKNTLTDLVDMFDNITPGAVIVSIVSLALIFFGESRYYKTNSVLRLVPAPLLVVFAGALVYSLLKGHPTFTISSEHMVNLPVINDLSDLRNVILFPDFSLYNDTRFWGVVLTLAIVASLESLLSVEAADKLDPQKRDSNSNRELVAQGIGNMASGALGGLPITAVIVRSSANINAGATSKMSSFIHGTLLLLSVLLIPQILMLIPNAALATILVITGYKLTNLKLYKMHYKRGIDQFLPFTITIVVMLFTDLLKGVAAGLVVAIIFIIRANIRNAAETAVDIIDGRKIFLMKLPQHVTFFNKGKIVRFLNSVPPESELIIDGTHNITVDSDVREVIQEFEELSAEKQIKTKHINFKP